MTDVFSREKRSQIMSHIRSTGTSLEKKFLKELSSKVYPAGFRYRKNCRSLPGCPDAAFPKYKIAIFLDGDFWHGYDFAKQVRRLPKRYWREKIRKNILRDRRNRNKLRRKGWRVIRIWEHQIKKGCSQETEKILNFLKKDSEKY